MTSNDKQRETAFRERLIALELSKDGRVGNDNWRNLAIDALAQRPEPPPTGEQHEDGLDSVRGMDADVARGEVGLQLLVDRFLRWPLPASVRSDDCACIQGYPHRIGTNLLTAIEAKEMLTFVLAAQPEPSAATVACPCGQRARQDCDAATCRYAKAAVPQPRSDK